MKGPAGGTGAGARDPNGETPGDRLAALAVLVAAVAFATLRVSPVDVPWHLATARLAEMTGHWPTRNTFSYTFPDHPIYQQYPIFQAVLYAVYKGAGWEGLSVMTTVGWIAALLLFVRWAGPWRQALPWHLLWMIGLCALQRRMILRPDLFTMLALGGMLVAMDAYARGRRSAIALVPLLHLFWINSHQLFPLSLMVQGLFIAHLALGRRGAGGVMTIDRAVSLRPPLLALLASLALCLATPLGIGIIFVTSHTAGSLTLMRDQVGEFRYVWSLPLELQLTLLSGAPAAWALWRARRCWSPLDVGLWLLSLALVLAAMRGLMFFGVISVAVTQRTVARLRAAGEPILPPVRPAIVRGLRAATVLATMLMAGNIVYHRWGRPPLALTGTQPGLGRSRGDWGDAAVAFLRANPPPGRVMNLTWATGNTLLWALPELPVFVDPRFESYPHAFLREAVDAYTDDARLAALIERHQPTWIIAEHFRDPIRARVVTLLHQGWTAVHVDSSHLIAVRDVPETAAYRARHAVELGRATPGDLLDEPQLRAQQEAQFAALRTALALPW